MNTLAPIKKHKYVPFFIQAIVALIFGISVWLGVFYSKISIDQPIETHIHFLFYGFFSSMILGFVFTAFPNFTGNKPVSFFTLSLLFILKMCGMLFLIFESRLFYLIWLIELVLIFYYLIQNVYGHFSRFPKSFLMILIGFSWQFFYLIQKAVFHSSLTDSNVLTISLHQGFVLNVILGVGLKVLPAMLGTSNVFQIEKSKKKSFFYSISHNFKENKVYFLIILLNLKFVIDMMLMAPSWNQLMLALFLFYIITFEVNIFSKKMQKTFFTFSVKIALLFIFLGVLLTSIPSFYIWALHIYFIAGVLLLTFLISGRVILAHGGFGLTLERSDKRLFGLVFLLVVGMLFRIVSYFFDWPTYESSLSLAIIFIFLFLFLWFSVYGNKLFTLIKGEENVGRKLL